MVCARVHEGLLDRLSRSHVVFFRRDLSLNLEFANLVGLIGQQITGGPVSSSPLLIFQLPTSVLHLGAWWRKSGLHICAGNTLSGEASTQPFSCKL